MKYSAFVTLFLASVYVLWSSLACAESAQTTKSTTVVALAKPQKTAYRSSFIPRAETDYTSPEEQQRELQKLIDELIAEIEATEAHQTTTVMQKT